MTSVQGSLNIPRPSILYRKDNAGGEFAAVRCHANREGHEYFLVLCKTPVFTLAHRETDDYGQVHHAGGSVFRGHYLEWDPDNLGRVYLLDVSKRCLLYSHLVVLFPVGVTDWPTLGFGPNFLCTERFRVSPEEHVRILAALATDII